MPCRPALLADSGRYVTFIALRMRLSSNGRRGGREARSQLVTGDFGDSISPERLEAEMRLPFRVRVCFAAVRVAGLRWRGNGNVFLILPSGHGLCPASEIALACKIGPCIPCPFAARYTVNCGVSGATFACPSACRLCLCSIQFARLPPVLCS